MGTRSIQLSNAKCYYERNHIYHLIDNFQEILERNDDDHQQPIASLNGYNLYDPIRGTCDFCHRTNIIVNRDDIEPEEEEDYYRKFPEEHDNPGQHGKYYLICDRSQFNGTYGAYEIIFSMLSWIIVFLRKFSVIILFFFWFNIISIDNNVSSVAKVASPSYRIIEIISVQ